MANLLQQVEKVTTYCLKFLFAGEERSVILQPVDAANGVILEETGEDTGILRGLLLSGRAIEIPFTSVLAIEQYKVTGNWGGNGNKTVKMTDDQIVDYTRNCGGEANAISKITDKKGEVIFDKNDDGTGKKKVI